MRLFIAMVIATFLVLSAAAECACMEGGSSREQKIKVSTKKMSIKVRTGMLIAGHRSHDDPMHPHYCGATTPDAQKGE